MRRINSFSLAVISICAAAMAFSSCQKDEIKGGADSRYVTLAVTAEEGVETKSAGSMFETVEIVEDGMSLFVDASVSVNRMNPFTAVATKGAEVTKDKIEEFNVLMTGTDNTTNSGVAKKSDMAHWAIYNGTAKVEWPNHDGSVKYDFLAYYLQGSNSSFATSGAYTGPESTVSAKDMNDFLLAKTSGRTHSESTYHSGEDNVPIHFYHPLAAVRFNVNGSVITKVTINNLKKDGTVEVKNVEYKDNESFASAIEWSNLSGKVSYSQSFTEAVNSEMFFIVPQDLADVTLTFDIVKDGATLQFSTKAKNLGTASWDAGYVYNYTVDTTADGKVGIVADEKFNKNDNTKSAVGAKNVARSTSYVRMYIVGNWCYNWQNEAAAGDKAGVVYDSWTDNISYDGVGKGWFKDGDFYYFESPLQGFTTTDTALITQYIVDNTKAPKSNVHLELRVMAQAVEWDAEKIAVTKAWGATVAGKLK